MQTRRRTGWGALLIGSIGIAMILAGGIVFFEQVRYWLREREWETATLRSLLLERRGNGSIPLLARWVQPSSGGWQELVSQFFDMIPVWVFLVVVGGWLALRAGRVRR